MFEINAEIAPSKSIGGINLGTEIQSLLNIRLPDSRTEISGSIKYRFGPFLIWEENRVVAQIGVMQGYLGKVQGKIGIGLSISDVEKEFGVVQEDDEDNLIINGQAGLRFDSDAQNTTGGIVVAPDSKITEIYVYHESS